MAIFHASFSIVKRSAGRSAVAAAAYRSGELLTDERTGEVHDYSRKRGVDDTFILSPTDAPEWASDRDKLWSTVELGEKRKDAQLARELNVALPRELSKSEATKLVKNYVKTNFVSKGMVADVALHDMDSKNPHAHVMLTMREISPDGFGPKNRDWNAKEQLVEWRHDWERSTNNQLKQSGQEARIDHRSLKDQGIVRLPTAHLGPHAHAMEKRGVATIKGDYNRKVVQIGEQRSKIDTAIDAGKRNQNYNAASIMASMHKGGSVLQKISNHNQEQKASEREQQEYERNRARRNRSHGH